MTDKRWIPLAAVPGSGIVFLDSTAANVALPHIRRDLPRLLLGIFEAQSYFWRPTEPDAPAEGTSRLGAAAHSGAG